MLIPPIIDYGSTRGVFEKVPGSGVWWIRYADASGRICREKAGLKQSALNLYRKRKTEVLQGKKLPETRKRVVSFEELTRDALDYSRAQKSHESYRNDQWNSEVLLKWFGRQEAAGISPQEIERKLAELAEGGRSPATINRYRALLSLIYSVGCRNGKVSVNPARLVRLRKENNARIRYLTADEEKTLRKQIRSLCPDRERITPH